MSIFTSRTGLLITQQQYFRPKNTHVDASLFPLQAQATTLPSTPTFSLLLFLFLVISSLPSPFVSTIGHQKSQENHKRPQKRATSERIAAVQKR